MPPKVGPLRNLPDDQRVAAAGPLPIPPAAPYPEDGQQLYVQPPQIHYAGRDPLSGPADVRYPPGPPWSGWLVDQRTLSPEQALYRQQFNPPGQKLLDYIRIMCRGTWNPWNHDRSVAQAALQTLTLPDDGEVFTLPQFDSATAAGWAFMAGIDITRGGLRRLTQMSHFWNYWHDGPAFHVPLDADTLMAYLRLVCYRVNVGTEPPELILAVEDDANYNDPDPTVWSSYPPNDPPSASKKMSCVVVDHYAAMDNLCHPTAQPSAVKWRDMLAGCGVTPEIFLLLDYIFIPLIMPNGHWVLAGFAPKQRLIFHIDSVHKSAQEDDTDALMLERSLQAYIMRRNDPDMLLWRRLRPRGDKIDDRIWARQQSAGSSAIFLATNVCCLAWGFSPNETYTEADIPAKRIRMGAELLTKGFRNHLAVRILPIPGYDAMKIWPAQWQRADIHNVRGYGDPTKMKIGGLGSTASTMTQAFTNTVEKLLGRKTPAPRRQTEMMLSDKDTNEDDQVKAEEDADHATATTLYPPQFSPHYFDIEVWLRPTPKALEAALSQLNMDGLRNLAKDTALDQLSDYKHWSKQNVIVFRRWLENAAVTAGLTAATIENARLGTVPIQRKVSMSRIPNVPKRDSARDALRIRKVSARTARIRKVTRSGIGTANM